eukprot:CAMPEP_0171094088 /NCGR_PEP_ID=MMETSP0766_2-20121228/39871_1 /TAXON_ID=439317 /ORGANISM="Gambierdiscus australes, Strain CAWD 149" /LENGTH=166 /DNA_ID=CAMNT_0011552643 /DNA_START=54 /DNA_END=554 /DNA_ORIENTATION=+
MSDAIRRSITRSVIDVTMSPLGRVAVALEVLNFALGVFGCVWELMRGGGGSCPMLQLLLQLYTAYFAYNLIVVVLTLSRKVSLSKPVVAATLASIGLISFALPVYIVYFLVQESSHLEECAGCRMIVIIMVVADVLDTCVLSPISNVRAEAREREAEGPYYNFVEA